jgi:membrane protein
MRRESATVIALSRPPRRWWHQLLLILQRAALNFSEDRGTHMAAAIAYYALFSLFPLMILGVSIFGLVIRDADRRTEVLTNIVNALPVSAPSVAAQLETIANQSRTVTLVALLVTLWSASALITAVRRSMDVAFSTDRARPLLRGKAIDILVLPALGTAFLAFMFLYWLLPTLSVRLRDIWGGALLATIGFEAVKQGFAIYVANYSNYDVVYGSLAGIMALLFWVYLSANILLFGAEVAAETPHVLHAEPRHGHASAAAEGEGSWRQSIWVLIKGLVLAPGDQTGPAMPGPEPSAPSTSPAASQPDDPPRSRAAGDR